MAQPGRAVLSTRRRYRRERVEDRRNRSIELARMQRIRGVRITAIPMPEWAQKRAIKGLSISESFIWLKSSDASFLMRLDEEAGGQPYASETEYRRCPVCARPLIGDDARLRRELDESARTGRQKPCGSDCIEAARDKRWRG